MCNRQSVAEHFGKVNGSSTSPGGTITMQTALPSRQSRPGLRWGSQSGTAPTTVSTTTTATGTTQTTAVTPIDTDTDESTGTPPASPTASAPTGIQGGSTPATMTAPPFINYSNNKLKDFQTSCSTNWGGANFANPGAMMNYLSQNNALDPLYNEIKTKSCNPGNLVKTLVNVIDAPDNIANMSSSIGTLANQVGNCATNSALTGLTSQVSGLTTQVGNCATNSAVSALQTQIATCVQPTTSWVVYAILVFLIIVFIMLIYLLWKLRKN